MSCVWTLTPAWVPGLHKAEEDSHINQHSIHRASLAQLHIYAVNLAGQNKG